MNIDTGLTVASEAQIAVSARMRLIGLMGRRVIAPEYALGIPDCDWIHTFGVRVPLDVAYCDREGRVLRLIENIPPNLVAPRVRGAGMAWETRAGGFSGRVREGQRLILQPSPKIASQTERQNV